MIDQHYGDDVTLQGRARGDDRRDSHQPRRDRGRGRGREDHRRLGWSARTKERVDLAGRRRRGPAAPLRALLRRLRLRADREEWPVRRAAAAPRQPVERVRRPARLLAVRAGARPRTHQGDSLPRHVVGPDARSQAVPTVSPQQSADVRAGPARRRVPAAPRRDYVRVVDRRTPRYRRAHDEHPRGRHGESSSSSSPEAFRDSTRSTSSEAVANSA